MDEEAKNRVRNEILDLAAGQATLVGKGAKEFAVLATEQIDDADKAIKSGDPDGVATQHVQLANAYATLALAASNQALLFERLHSSALNQ
ncbi:MULTISPECIES: hypothetical protein [Rhodococcus erythropolis group]|uniref:Uncharacterized protein n=1 Tax=Rhodococcus baikonurensis TaxID=172041 RepID=A0ABV5XPG1_9NOCA|nr:hypothetical protein [Rhodococcus qingshengii]KSU63018.1 hypothetical protein AS032_33635 [Rhodococcus qingshengii]SCC70319.1 hypothetical protein GA0061093_1394 [Rhodococcus qingshengii]